MGADFIEQDMILFKDNQPEVLHDLTIDGTTNENNFFLGRNRKYG